MKKPARFKKGDVVLYFRKCPRWMVEGKSPLEKGKEYAIINVQTWGRSTGYCLRLPNGAHWWVTGECLKLSDKQPRPLREGDKVMIVRKPDMAQEKDNGYHNGWFGAGMDPYINNGKVYTIRIMGIPGSGILLEEDDNAYRWPAGCFQLVE